MASPPPEPTLDFPIHAKEVTRAVRGAFASLLASAGANPVDMQSIVRHVGLNKNLAWKLSRISRADDPATVIEQMPGGGALKIFFNRMEQVDGDAELLDQARKAIADYQKLIELHSGDRETLAMMSNGLSSIGRLQRDEQQRKLSFQGTSYTWGVQARVNFKKVMFGPSKGEGGNGGGNGVDIVSVSMLIDFRRLRPGARWVMAMRMRFHDGAGLQQIPVEAVDPRYESPDVAPLMADFCSNPLPQLHRYVDGALNKFELVEGRVGNTGALTCAIGTIHRQIEYGAIPGQDWGGNIVICDTPTELLISDYIVHESLEYALSPQLELHSLMQQSASLPSERTRLPISETFEDLGRDPLILPAPEVPRHREMTRALFDRMGWNPAEFHARRLRMAYPPCPTALVAKFSPPGRPAKSPAGGL